MQHLRSSFNGSQNRKSINSMLNFTVCYPMLCIRAVKDKPSVMRHSFSAKLRGHPSHYVQSQSDEHISQRLLFLLSVVVYVNNWSIFCIWRAPFLYLYTNVCVPAWYMREMKSLLSSFVLQQKKGHQSTSLLRRCLTVCSRKKRVLLGSISGFCSLQLLQWKPLTCTHVQQQHTLEEVGRATATVARPTILRVASQQKQSPLNLTCSLRDVGWSWSAERGTFNTRADSGCR